MSDIIKIKGEGFNEIELERNTIEHAIIFHCKDGWSNCCLELSKDKAIELANKILELCGDRPIITGIGINKPPKSPKSKFPEETYSQVNNVDNKRFFDGYKPEYFETDNDLCDLCYHNPKNGGSGVCNCTLATYKSY